MWYIFFPFLIFSPFLFFPFLFFLSPGFFFFLLLSIPFKLAPPLQCSSIFLVMKHINTLLHTCVVNKIFVFSHQAKYFNYENNGVINFIVPVFSPPCDVPVYQCLQVFLTVTAAQKLGLDILLHLLQDPLLGLVE